MSKKSLTGFLKRQTFAIYWSLLVIVLGTSAVSYALFSATKYSSNEQVVQSGTFKINFTSGSTITNNVFISTDEEGMSTTGYTFTVSNSGSIKANYAILVGRTSTGTEKLVQDKYFRYSLDGQGARSLISQPTYSNTAMYPLEIITLDSGANKSHNLKIWLAEDTPDTELGNNVNLSIQIVAVPTDPSQPTGQQFSYTGNEEIFTAPYTGIYTITATGAQGAVGNKYGYLDSPLKGGKGAKISSNFYLEEGDKLRINVGGMGNTTMGTSSDGFGGAGGGGSFIFKEITSKDSSKGYQFTKSSQDLETLLVAAGGGGTGDIGYSSTYRTRGGYDGNASNYYSPDNYIAYSSTASTGYSSSVLGIGQYISYGLKSTSANYRGSVCTGGFGGGGCQNDSYGYGGGWYGSNNVTYSFSSGTETVGVDGAQEGNGYVNISYVPIENLGREFAYIGKEETFTVPKSGTYTIEAAGAEGAVGNSYGFTTGTYKGGKGAIISANFELNAGDILYINVGGKGSTTSGTMANGASGAGGGGSFIFKKISSIADNRFQFKKGTTNFDTLLVAAGGSGTGDIGYSSSTSYRNNGYDASTSYKSPTNFSAYSTATTNSSSSNSYSTTSVLGINQYINYDLRGAHYIINGSECYGGFGGGGCATDYRSYGGGWAGSNYVTYSWSQGDNTSISATNEGNGYVIIKYNG